MSARLDRARRERNVHQAWRKLVEPVVKEQVEALSDEEVKKALGGFQMHVCQKGRDRHRSVSMSDLRSLLEGALELRLWAEEKDEVLSTELKPLRKVKRT